MRDETSGLPSSHEERDPGWSVASESTLYPVIMYSRSAPYSAPRQGLLFPRREKCFNLRPSPSKPRAARLVSCIKREMQGPDTDAVPRGRRLQWAGSLPAQLRRRPYPGLFESRSVSLLWMGKVVAIVRSLAMGATFTCQETLAGVWLVNTVSSATVGALGDLWKRASGDCMGCGGILEEEKGGST